MPAEAVGFDLYFTELQSPENTLDSVDSLDAETVNRIQQIVSETGFHPDPHDESIMGGTFNFQPFENTPENKELLEECVKEIETEFPKLDASYNIKKNRNRGVNAAKMCNLAIDSGN